MEAGAWRPNTPFLLRIHNVLASLVLGVDPRTLHFTKIKHNLVYAWLLKHAVHSWESRTSGVSQRREKGNFPSEGHVSQTTN